MYSVVMMMALTAGADAPDCHRNRCSGCAVSYSCSGCNVGSACSGGCACSGRHRLFHRNRGHGCHGGCACSAPVVYSCGGGCACSGGVVVMPGGPGPAYKGPGSTLPPPTKGKGKKKAPPPTTEETSTGSIVVNVPAGALVTVDGVPTTSTAANRVFITPALEPGYEYYYTLRAETVRDGQTVAQTQQVAVRPGEQSQVTFDFSTGGVAANR
jgi:uncharacterized protein (TIGR03000 family)